MSSSKVTDPEAERDRLHDEAAALFQPRAKRKLTREDGREITHNLTGFFRLLLEWDRKERAARKGAA
jgi:hypothetical protein